MAAPRENGSEFPFNSSKEYELKLGSSFNSRGGPKTAFHTIRYDFKPASVDTSRPAELVVGDTNEITVTVPHVQDSGTTVYRGSKRRCAKEFILVVDKEKKTFTLERIESSIPQLKKQRSSSQPSKAVKLPAAPATATSTKPQKSKSKKKQVEKKATNSSPVKTTSPPTTSQENAAKSEGAALSAESESGSSSSSDSSDSEKDENEGEEEFDEKDAEKVFSLMTSMDQDTAPSVSKKEQGFNTLCEDLQLSESGSDSD